MSNGAVLSPQSNHADNNNDAKKVNTTFTFRIENTLDLDGEYHIDSQEF